MQKLTIPQIEQEKAYWHYEKESENLELFLFIYWWKIFQVERLFLKITQDVKRDILLQEIIKV